MHGPKRVDRREQTVALTKLLGQGILEVAYALVEEVPDGASDDRLRQSLTQRIDRKHPAEER